MSEWARRWRFLALAVAIALLLVTGLTILSRGYVPRVGSQGNIMLNIRHLLAIGLGLTAPAGPGDAQTQVPSSSLPSPPPPVLGINVADIQYFSSTAPFANLAIGSEWNDTQWKHLTQDRVDRDGNLLSVPADGVATRFLLVPPTGPEGFEASCTFTGAGKLEVEGISGPVRTTERGIIFRLVNERGKQTFPWLKVTGFDPARPLRNLDCRDVRLSKSVRFRPEWLQFLRGFKVIRFMDWQHANANVAVPWRERHTPDTLYFDRDGVSIEDMLEVVHELDADPWFVMPWNADNDYITRFAQMVRAQLPADRSVYVEVGNEVWNTAFPVGKQAIKEGLERRLSTKEGEASTRRYAQRTAEVMQIWETVFAGRHGLVRVLATQHDQPWLAEAALSYRDTEKHVDALATAFYFGGQLGDTNNTRESTLLNLNTTMNKTFDLMIANRSIALKHRKRYIGYEGGVGVALPSQTDLLTKLQHDDALYGVYQRFLTGWAQRTGDVLCHYSSVSRPTSWGMWGLAEWENDTLAEAPKLRAVRDFLTRQGLVSNRSPAAR